jgi:hypothetical protein
LLSYIACGRYAVVRKSHLSGDIGRLRSNVIARASALSVEDAPNVLVYAAEKKTNQ